MKLIAALALAAFVSGCAPGTMDAIKDWAQDPWAGSSSIGTTTYIVKPLCPQGGCGNSYTVDTIQH